MFHRQAMYGCYFLREKPHFQIGKKKQFHAAGNTDQLLKKKDAIEEHLYERQRSLFHLQETITLNDLTNT